MKVQTEFNVEDVLPNRFIPVDVLKGERTLSLTNRVSIKYVIIYENTK